MLRISPILAAPILLSAAAHPAYSQPSTSSTPSHGPSAYVQSTRDALTDGPNGHVAPSLTFAAHEEPSSGMSKTAADDVRRIGPLTREPTTNETTELAAPTSPLGLSIPRRSITTALGALSLVSGLLLLSMWGLKRKLPPSTRILPAEVCEILGRAPLSVKQHAHLIKLGEKLVFVFVAPTGVQALTEITDPEQVARLVALCSPSDQSHAKKSFDDILKELSSEPVRGGYGRA